MFRYKNERWDIFESLRPWDIREAIKIGLQRIEDAVPGTLEKAAELDDQNWRNNKRRTRRYIAEASELLYIDSASSAGAVRIGGRLLFRNQHSVERCPSHPAASMQSGGDRIWNSK